jgi:hypothetical protein
MRKKGWASANSTPAEALCDRSGLGLRSFGHAPALRVVGCTPWGTMGKARERQIILKIDQRTFVFEMGLGGKFQAKASGWDENLTFLEGDDLEVAVRNGWWVLNHVPAWPRPSPPPA